MEELETINGTDSQDNGRGKTNRNFARIKGAIDYALDPITGHDHDGLDSVKISHSSLENSGMTSHAVIDSDLDTFETHIEDSDIHSTSQEKSSWSDMITEVQAARNSSSKGAFNSLDDRLEEMEEASTPTIHDDSTGRFISATGAEPEDSRHMAVAVWDVTGSHNVQTSLNDLYINGGSIEESEDTIIPAGETSIDGGTPETFYVSDRLSALYSSATPVNEILNGTFNYLGLVYKDPEDDVLGNSDGTLLAHGHQQNTTYIPGWWVYSTSESFETKCHIFCPSGYPAPPIPGYSPTQKYFNYWHGIGFFEIIGAAGDTTSINTEVYSYPMPLVSGETYTLTWWYCKKDSSDNTTGKMTIQCQDPITGDIEELTTFDFPLTDNLWHHKTVTFTAQTYNGEKRGLHRLHIHCSATSTFTVSKMGLFRGDFNSDIHAIPDASYSSRMLEDTVEYPYCTNITNESPTVLDTFQNGKLFKKTVMTVVVVASDSNGDLALFVPPNYYIYNIKASPNYFAVKNMNIDRVIGTPAITSSDFSTPSNVGNFPDGSTFYYVVSLVNDFGESVGTEVFPVTISGGDGTAGVLINLTFNKGNATKIRIYRGSSRDNIGLLAEIDASITAFLDTDYTSQTTSEKPKKYPEALFAPNDMWFSWERTYVGGINGTPSTTVDVNVIPPKTGTGTVVFKIELWPAAMGWPTFGE